jgi:hypothetical protein
MSFYKNLVLIDRVLQQNIKGLLNKVNIIDDVDKTRLIKGLCIFEGFEQSFMIKKTWRMDGFVRF